MREFNIINDNDSNSMLSTIFFPDGFHGEIITRTEQLLSHATTLTSNVFIVRLDLRYPIDYPAQSSNTIFTNFLNSFNKYLVRKHWALGYIWRLEATERSLGHYHLALFLDGNRIQNSWSILEKSTNLWGMALGTVIPKGLVQLCKPNSSDSHFHCGFQLKKYKPDFARIRSDVLCWLSYMAKASQDTQIYGFRQWGSSLL